MKFKKRPNYSNLSEKDKKALQERQSRDDIVITEADKGGAVAILGCRRLHKISGKTAPQHKKL